MGLLRIGPFLLYNLQLEHPGDKELPNNNWKALALPLAPGGLQSVNRLRFGVHFTSPLSLPLL